MAYSVKTELKENEKFRWNAYRVKANSFLELITGIDEIEEKHLGWLNVEGISSSRVTIDKRNGKWVAALEGHPDRKSN